MSWNRESCIGQLFVCFKHIKIKSYLASYAITSARQILSNLRGHTARGSAHRVPENMGSPLVCNLGYSFWSLWDLLYAKTVYCLEYWGDPFRKHLLLWAKSRRSLRCLGHCKQVQTRIHCLKPPSSHPKFFIYLFYYLIRFVLGRFLW